MTTGIQLHQFVLIIFSPLELEITALAVRKWGLLQSAWKFGGDFPDSL